MHAIAFSLITESHICTQAQSILSFPSTICHSLFAFRVSFFSFFLTSFSSFSSFLDLFIGIPFLYFCVCAFYASNSFLFRNDKKVGRLWHEDINFLCEHRNQNDKISLFRFYFMKISFSIDAKQKDLVLAIFHNLINPTLSRSHNIRIYKCTHTHTHTYVCSWARQSWDLC